MRSGGFHPRLFLLIPSGDHVPLAGSCRSEPVIPKEQSPQPQPGAMRAQTSEGDVCATHIILILWDCDFHRTEGAQKRRRGYPLTTLTQLRKVLWWQLSELAKGTFDVLRLVRRAWLLAAAAINSVGCDSRRCAVQF